MPREHTYGVPVPTTFGTRRVLRSAYSMRRSFKAFYHVCLSVAMGAGVAAMMQHAAATAVVSFLTQKAILPPPKQRLLSATLQCREQVSVAIGIEKISVVVAKPQLMHICSSSTTLSSATSLSTTSGISSPTSSASTATDTTFASTSSPNQDNSGTKVGLSVGLGIPLAALLAGGSVWCFLRRKKRPQGSHPSGSDPGLRHDFHLSGSDEGLQHGSHLSGSDEGLQHGFFKPSAMPPATSPKIELSGEGKSIHELQSLSRSPGYQRHHYSDSQSPDLQSRDHVSYELA
ncbi:hypothetical protein J7T55_014914 [Diaporthe amygdali]|uniref:uncharacterized protein n=1 Tax=Phomopsis amygdali TaxID=1214568 RepID=UPI0022FEDA8D|nr:uncharacterized protein J7T55_014914 [Diaporthe amygdali]KAJ0106839.1 hypothetical protein J7T55_014914 [Diaporthe amygdali]